MIYELATVLFELFLICFYLHKLFLKSSKPPLVFGASFLLFGAGLALLSLLPIAPIIRLLYTWCGIFILCRICFISSVLHAVYAGASLCVIALITEVLCYWLLLMLGWESMLSTGLDRAIYILVSKMVQLILVMVATVFMHKEQFLLKLRGIIPLLLCQAFSIYACDSILVISQNSAGNLSSHTFFPILIGILYLNVVIIVYTEIIKARQQERYDADLRQQKLELQLGYYKSLQLEQEQTRALYHDISKHLTAMEAMVSHDNKSSAAQLLLDVKDSFQKVGKLVDVGNWELSAILNHYVQRARELDIPVSLAAWVPSTMAISALDLSITIGNTFENAIEACLALPAPQRDISLRITTHNHILYYEISNRHAQGKKQRLQSGNPYHGYGMGNVQKIVTKYNGTFHVSNDGSWFHVVICLNVLGLV